MSQPSTSFRSELAVEAHALRSLARSLVGSVDADDAVQETFVAALKQPSPPRTLGPWLRRVLRNEVRAGARRDRRRQVRERAVAPAEHVDGLDIELEHAELIGAMTELLDGLQEPYREILRQRFLLGRSALEIARQIGDPPSTVRWRVHEGLRRMREKLDERYDGRQRWLGSLLPFVGGPATSPTPTGTAMNVTSTTSFSVLAGALIVAGIATSILIRPDASASTASATTPRASDGPELSSAAARPSASVLQSMSAPGASGGGPCEGQGCDPSVAEGPANPPSNPLSVALDECAHLAELQGLERLEVEVEFVGGAAEEGTLVTSVLATSGRKMPCGDPVEDAQAADAPGVVRHDALSECVRESMDPSAFSFSPLPEGQIRHFTQFIALTDKEPAAALPAVPSDEAIPDPQSAIAEYGLTALGGAAAESDISVIECGDYDCPFCRKANAKLDELRERYPEVAVYWLHNPLVPMHDTALPAARAAVAADEQGKFWPFHDALFAKGAQRDRASLVDLADELGLDVARFEADMDAPATDERIARQAAVCKAAGARGTPSFFVNGDLLVGNQPIDQLIELVEAAKP